MITHANLEEISRRVFFVCRVVEYLTFFVNVRCCPYNNTCSIPQCNSAWCSSLLLTVLVLQFLSLWLQASLTEILVTESDPGPARLILYSNMPITCQAKIRNPITMTYEYKFCKVTFSIRSSEDIAVRQRLPYDFPADKTRCKYELNEGDWKPVEGYAYDGNRSLDVVAKVCISLEFKCRIALQSLACSLFSKMRLKVPVIALEAWPTGRKQRCYLPAHHRLWIARWFPCMRLWHFFACKASDQISFRTGSFNRQFH